MQWLIGYQLSMWRRNRRRKCIRRNMAKRGEEKAININVEVTASWPMKAGSRENLA
jgi:hypothetical protein